MSSTPFYIKPGTTLFPNQQSNVQLLLKRRKALLTDRVGSGKSLSILYSFAILKERSKLSNLLVLTPLSAYSKEVWKKDILKFTTLTCIDLETLYKLSNHSLSKLQHLLSQYSIIYGKHTHVKSYTKFLQVICSLPSTLLTIDECFTYNTRVLCRGKAISSHSPNAVKSRALGWLVENKIPCEVLSLNSDKQFEFKPITNWFSNGVRDVYRVYFNTGNYSLSVDATSNQLFLTDAGYRPLSSLQPNDLIYTALPNKFGTNIRKVYTEHIEWNDAIQVMYGTLLGDSGFNFGEFVKGHRQSRFYIMHGTAQLEYLKYKYRIFRDLLKPLQVTYLHDWGREREMYRYTSGVYNCFDDVISILYDHTYRKHITREFLNKLSPLALAVWYMDDGAFCGWRFKDGNRVKATPNANGIISLSTHGFSKEENLIIISYFREVWGIKFELKLDKRCNKYFLTTKDCYEYISIVAPYVIDIFEYKLGWYAKPGNKLKVCVPLKFYRTCDFVKVSNYSAPCGTISLHKGIVTRIESLNSQSVYDIEVADNHNFVANSAVVHNCHALKNPKAEITLLTRQISSHSQSLWGITGSTISKSLEDFYNIVNLIYPWYFGSFTQFRETYCTYREKTVGYLNGKRRKVLQITGIKDPVHFQNAISPLVISGQSFLSLHFHYLDYNLSTFEQTLYRKIARGIFTPDSPDWFQSILSSPELPVPHIKEVDLYSSRFLYLQSAADGILNEDGSQTRLNSSKLSLLLQTVQSIVSKHQSLIIYFAYYVSLNVVKQSLLSLNLNATILESTGSHVLKDSDVTEAKCKIKPHIILGTKASSESVSLYFINNVIFFHIPTVPSTFVQTVGRITRKNTLFPDDLNVFIFRSNNIDLYKLLVVSSKTYQMELVQGQEDNIPPDYKQQMSKLELLDQAKKLLLWNN